MLYLFVVSYSCASNLLLAFLPFCICGICCVYVYIVFGVVLAICTSIVVYRVYITTQPAIHCCYLYIRIPCVLYNHYVSIGG